MDYDYSKLTMGDGHAAVPLTEDDRIRDDIGFTNPNLHRRIDKQDQEIYERALRDYQLRIQGIYSYRTTTKYYYDDNLNPNNIP